PHSKPDEVNLIYIHSGMNVRLEIDQLVHANWNDHERDNPPAAPVAVMQTASAGSDHDPGAIENDGDKKPERDPLAWFGRPALGSPECFGEKQHGGGRHDPDPRRAHREPISGT